MRAHLWAGGSAPIEYVDMLMCERFGWTIEELDNTPADRIQQFLSMWVLETEFAKPQNKGIAKNADL